MYCKCTIPESFLFCFCIISIITLFGFTLSCLSVCSFVPRSDLVLTIFPEPLNHYYYFFTKLGMVVYYHEVMCHAEKVVHYLQCQGQSKGLYNQNMTVSIIPSKLPVHLEPNLVWWYSVINQSVLCKNWVTAFKGKVTAKVQNVSEYLFGWYLLNRTTFC